MAWKYEFSGAWRPAGNPTGRNSRPRCGTRYLRGRHYSPRPPSSLANSAQGPSHRHQRPPASSKALLGPTRPATPCAPVRSRTCTKPLPAGTTRVNNYAVADIHGCFGYLHEGRIPRARGRKRLVRCPRLDWRARVAGLHPPRRVAQSHRPRNRLCHYLQPAPVTGSDYPYYVGLVFSPDYRARRIQTRILELAKGTATPEAMGHIHAERVSLPSPSLYAGPCSPSSRPPPTVPKPLDLLHQWGLPDGPRPSPADDLCANPQPARLPHRPTPVR